MAHPRPKFLAGRAAYREALEQELPLSELHDTEYDELQYIGF